MYDERLPATSVDDLKVIVFSACVRQEFVIKLSDDASVTVKREHVGLWVAGTDLLFVVWQAET